jgi:hypothetical protein
MFLIQSAQNVALLLVGAPMAAITNTLAFITAHPLIGLYPLINEKQFRLAIHAANHCKGFYSKKLTAASMRIGAFSSPSAYP